jgi:preprotein translocase subunit SecG
LRIVFYILVTVQILIGLGLIYVIAIQESKTEGLQGQIGTTVASSFKGKTGREERLNLLTRNLAIAFMVICGIVAFGTGRWDQ